MRNAGGIERYIKNLCLRMFSTIDPEHRKRDETNWLISTFLQFNKSKWTKILVLFFKKLIRLLYKLDYIWLFADEVGFDFPFGSGGNHSTTIPATTTELKALVVTVFLPAIAQHSRWSPKDLLQQLSRVRHSVHPPIQTSKTRALLPTGEWISFSMVIG